MNYSDDYEGALLKSIGVSKVAALAYGISPSATESAKSSLAAAKLSGIGTCLSDLSVPSGGVDFTASVLAMKSAGCTGATTDFGLYGSYIAADLMIKGLEEAGKNPTAPRSSPTSAK